jgi:hypothetical protein
MHATNDRPKKLPKALNLVSEIYFDKTPYMWICMGQNAEIFPLNFGPLSSKDSSLQA